MQTTKRILQILNRILQTLNCRLHIPDFKLSIVDCILHSAGINLQIAYCRCEILDYILHSAHCKLCIVYCRCEILNRRLRIPSIELQIADIKLLTAVIATNRDHRQTNIQDSVLQARTQVQYQALYCTILCYFVLYCTNLVCVVSLDVVQSVTKY